MSSPPRVLITGSTGLIGSAVARGFGDAPLWHLVRAGTESQARARISSRCLQGRSPPGAWRCLPADLTRANLGLSARHLDEVRAECDTVLHLAADTSLAAGGRCHETNVTGVERLLDLAHRFARPPLFVFASTAYVCGSVRDAELDERVSVAPAAMHHTAYTRSKAEAERLVGQSGLDSLILRPSIVVGDAGAPPQEGLASFVRAVEHLGSLPIRESSRVDIVPLSYVAEAVHALLSSRGHKIYHLTAGRRSLTCAQLAAIEASASDRLQPVKLVGPAVIPGQHHRATASRRQAQRVIPFLPFLDMNVTFDNSRILSEQPHLGRDLGDIERVLTAAISRWREPELSSLVFRGSRPPAHCRSRP